MRCTSLLSASLGGAARASDLAHMLTPTCLYMPRSFPSFPLSVLSASLDGTVRAFDLVRYRNFRTLTTPTPVQFVSLSVDPGGEVRACAQQGWGRVGWACAYACAWGVVGFGRPSGGWGGGKHTA